jgi:CheY-like chemotaxis protein
MSKRSKGLLKISEVAQEAGVLTSTVRYYTDIGLLTVSSETPGGHRLYERDATLSAIKKIQFLNQQGKTMEEIKNELTTATVQKKLLVIDDEPEVGNLIIDLVQSHFNNIEVRVVRDGFSAGRVLSEYLPDLIILDLMLPGVNGFAVCQQIRATEHLSRVKILAVTGYDSPDNKQKILSCGADDYLAKPMDLHAIESKIVSLLQIKAKRPVLPA